MLVLSLTSLRRTLIVLLAGALLLTACTGDPQAAMADDSTESPSESDQHAASDAGPEASDSQNETGDSPGPPAGKNEPEPVPYIPAGRPGNAEDYDELMRLLEAEVPAELRAEVPWPDLQSPNPIDAQISIFELWIWMAENYPEPILVQAMTAPGSPSREIVTGVFGAQDANGVLETRTGTGYRAFDHVVVTFESAGLPLWLARDVPDDAVVVYYSDDSGAVDVTDRETGAFIERRPAVATRTWLSIMVPTDVGWQLWRDQLIEPSDSELEVPDVPPPPGAEEDRRVPDV